MFMGKSTISTGSFSSSQIVNVYHRDFSTICDSEKSDMPSIAIQDGAPVWTKTRSEQLPKIFVAEFYGLW